MVAVGRPQPSPPRAYHFPAFRETTLDNGVRVITCPLPKLPLVTIVVVIDNGSATEPRGKEGIARITAKSLIEGTTRLLGSELSDALEKLGTAIHAGADWDSSMLRVTFLSEHLDRVIGLLGDVILEPTFPEREVQRLKDERIADLVQIESEPRALADQRFEEFLYSSDSRYARPAEGSRESVSALAREDVEVFHRASYAAARTTVVVAGDVAPDVITSKLAARLGRCTTAASSAAGAGANSSARMIRTVRIVEKADAPQSEVRVGHVGVPRSHRDYFSLVVMNAVLGGLFGSRINLNLREVRGYTYGASSYFDWRRDAGPFVISTAVQSEVTAAALKEIFLEVDRMRVEKVSESELSLAKDYLDGVFPIRYETTSAIASALANMTIHNLPRDYYDTYRHNVQRVSAADVLRAAYDHLRPAEMQTLIVGHRALVRDAVAELGIGSVEA